MIERPFASLRPQEYPYPITDSSNIQKSSRLIKAQALRRLRQAGIQTIADEQAGAETYVALRNRWNGYIRGIAPMLAYTAEEIDPAGVHPESSDERVEFRACLHSAGIT